MYKTINDADDDALPVWFGDRGEVLWACIYIIVCCCCVLFLSDSFADEVAGNIEVPWFCVVVVSNICVEEVEDLVSPPRVT